LNMVAYVSLKAIQPPEIVFWVDRSEQSEWWTHQPGWTCKTSFTNIV
jgi:hypothetical protein